MTIYDEEMDRLELDRLIDPTDFIELYEAVTARYDAERAVTDLLPELYELAVEHFPNGSSAEFMRETIRRCARARVPVRHAIHLAQAATRPALELTDGRVTRNRRRELRKWESNPEIVYYYLRGETSSSQLLPADSEFWDGFQSAINDQLDRHGKIRYRDIYAWVGRWHNKKLTDRDRSRVEAAVNRLFPKYQKR